VDVEKTDLEEPIVEIEKTATKKKRSNKSKKN
jgi:hypothetical protein